MVLVRKRGTETWYAARTSLGSSSHAMPCTSSPSACVVCGTDTASSWALCGTDLAYAPSTCGTDLAFAPICGTDLAYHPTTSLRNVRY
eukprot:3516563-Rhodomonas_salina.1